MFLVTIAIFFAQILNYGILTINFRSVAQGHVKTMVITDMMCASLAFFLIKKISEAAGDALLPFAGYVIGGAVGSVIGLRVSKWLHRNDPENKN